MKVEKNLDATLVAMAVAPVVVVALVPLGVLAVAQAVAQELAKVVVVVHALMEVEGGNIKLLTGTWQSGIAKNITFIVTKDCQLACRYCYLVGKNEKERMSWDVAKKAIDYILDHENDMREESVVWDFIGGEPDVEDDTEGQRGRYEVILVGGNPDIVPIGVITGLDGWMFTVWVPNEAGFVECGLRMLAQGDIPHDVMYVDEVELEQAFDMYSQKLQEDARVADEKDAPPEKDDVPDFDYDEYYASERGERPEPDIPELP
jgi:hypothetical protein